MPGKSFADVQTQAQSESGIGPVWGNAPDPSALPFHATFSGTVTADATMNKLAIFSDDGCDVTVDGVKVWSARDKGQALPDTDNSLHELPVTLSAGDHTVQIDYSNVIYVPADPSKGIPPDIDGCTLFLYGAAFTVKVLPGQISPNPAAVGTQMTASLSAKINNPPQSTSNTTITGPTWGWKVYSVEASQDGTTFTTATSDSYAIGISQTDSTKPDATFTVTFSQGAYYRVQVTATATYHSVSTNGSAVDISQSATDYVIGFGLPASSSSNSAASSSDAATPHSLTAHDTSAAPSSAPALGPGNIVLSVSQKIYRNDQDVTNTTIPVMAGEGVTLTTQTTPNLDPLLAALGGLGDWTASGGIAIGGYNTNPTAGGPIALQTSGKAFKIYWVNGSNAQVSLAVFTAIPPVTVNFAVTVPTASVSGVMQDAEVNDEFSSAGSYNIHLGGVARDHPEVAGIVWTFNVDISKGHYQWGQLITSESGNRTDKNNIITHEHWLNGYQGSFPASDNGWPYYSITKSLDTTFDAPAIGLDNNLGLSLNLT